MSCLCAAGIAATTAAAASAVQTATTREEALGVAVAATAARTRSDVLVRERSVCKRKAGWAAVGCRRLEGSDRTGRPRSANRISDLEARCGVFRESRRCQARTEV